MFDQSFLIGGASGGPNYSTMTVVLYLYNQAIKNISFGYGASIGVVLFLFIFTVTVFQRLLFGKAEVS
jgi:ABC-type sugar transport system permease subunit